MRRAERLRPPNDTFNCIFPLAQPAPMQSDAGLFRRGAVDQPSHLLLRRSRPHRADLLRRAGDGMISPNTKWWTARVLFAAPNTEVGRAGPARPTAGNCNFLAQMPQPLIGATTIHRQPGTLTKRPDTAKNRFSAGTMQLDSRLPPHPAPKRHRAGLSPEWARPEHRPVRRASPGERPGALRRARVRGTWPLLLHRSGSEFTRGVIDMLTV